jgi:hypothetical protein
VRELACRAIPASITGCGRGCDRSCTRRASSERSAHVRWTYRLGQHVLGARDPWHGLGAVLDEPPATVAEAIEASGLGWRVAKEPIAIDRGEAPGGDWWLPRCEEIPGFYATVRQDTREVLGIAIASCRTTRYSRSSTSCSAARFSSRRPAACTAAGGCGCSRRCPITSRSGGRRAPTRAADEQPRRLDGRDRCDHAGEGVDVLDNVRE